MFISSLRLILRNLFSQKVYTLINLSGLSVGLGGAFILILFVFNELGYDRFNKNLDQIYRINTEARSHEISFAKAPFVLGTTLKTDLPEEFIIARTFNLGSSNILYRNELIKEDRIYSADPEIFDILTFKVRKGNIKEFDGSPNAAVITEGMAARYFGTEDPIGKSIVLENNGTEFMLDVVAMIDDLPDNSSFRPEMLISHEISLRQMDQLITTSSKTPYGAEFFATSWSMYLFFNTYILIPEDQSTGNVETLMLSYEGKHFEKQLSIQFHLQKYTDIYLESTDLAGFYNGGNKKYVFISAFVALLLILTATLNYILLSTSIMHQRRSEMGLKLIHGAGRGIILREILLESIAFVLIAMIIGLTLAELLLPKISQLLFGKLLTINYIYNWRFSLMVLFLSVFIGTLSGTLLSLNVLAHVPVELIRFRETYGRGRTGLTKVLNTVQLIVSITLIICTATIFIQLRYLISADMGFELENVISINVGDEALKSSYSAIKERVASLPGVENVSGSMWAPPTKSDMRMTISRLDNTEEQIQAQGLMVDYKIVETLGLRLVEGRDFNPDMGSEAGNLIVNEQAVIAMGIDSSALGVQTNFGTIIGVVEDFHIHSLHRIVPPMVIQFMPGGVRSMLVKIDPSQGEQVIRKVEEICHDFEPDKSMEYAFLVDSMEELYNEEKRFVSIMTIFSGLNLFISLLGIFGMARLDTGRRTREVGIRKVMGAEASQILRRFLYTYMVVAIVACLVAFPAGYFLMTKWLSNFEYHGKINLLVFLLAGAVSILVVIITISYHVIRAANTNPIDSIRYE
jgi:putative ABC transport system permease protein